MRRLLFALLALAFVLGVSRADAKYVPPPIAGHVTDAAGRLSPSEIAALNEKLATYRKCSTNHVAVFFPKSLEGNSIEDVAYATFNTWKIGEAQKDNGVLLVLATNERRVRIETGKGVGGQLTDVESAHILRDDVNPNLKENRFFAAADQATTSIATKLGGCSVANVSPASIPPKADAPSETLVLRLALTAGAAFLLFVTMIPWRTLLSSLVIAALAGLAFFGLVTLLGHRAGQNDWVTIIALGSAANGFLFLATIVSLIIRGSKSGAGSSGSGDSSWSSSSYDSSSSSSSSSDGGSSYSGGGGSSGGGGASDSY